MTRHLRKSTLSIGRKFVFAGITTILFFGALEIVLFFCSVHPRVLTEDPLVGFQGSTSLLVEQSEKGQPPVMATRTNKLVWFNDQSFSKHKPAGTRRVFCLGGSTTFGRPYSDKTSFCGWLREYLAEVEDSQKWEVINAGGVSYASYRVAVVMQELCQYEPDLFIIFSAHNEFLENRTYSDLLDRSAWLSQAQAWAMRSRTYALMEQLSQWGPTRSQTRETKRTLLPMEVDERLNHTIGPTDYFRNPEWTDGVLRHYEMNLNRMVELARQAGAQVVLINPAVNEKDCSPFKSESIDLTDGDRESLNQLLRDARQQLRGNAMTTNEVEAVLQRIEDAVDVDDHHAELQFLLGRAQFHLEHFSQAQDAFQRAVDEDVCALRATSAIQHVVQQIANSSRVPLVDMDQRLRDLCFQEQGHRCLGREYFLDHVHPTIRVHRHLAWWIMEEMQAAKLLLGKPLEDLDVQRSFATTTERVLDGIDVKSHGIAMRNLAKVLHWSGKFEEALDSADGALVLMPEDSESQFVRADCLKNLGDYEMALEQYNRLFDLSPDYARAFLPFGELLTDLGHSDQALGYLISAILYEPANSYAHYTLGRLHMQRKEWQFAAEALEQANTLNPNDPGILRLLGELNRTGRLAEEMHLP